MAGVAVHFGNIAEVPAGEGKTLAVTRKAAADASCGKPSRGSTPSRRPSVTLSATSAACPPSSSATASKQTPTPPTAGANRGLTSGVMRDLEQQVLLNVIDLQWREHLTRASVLRDKIWRGDLDAATQLAEYRRQSRELLDRTITEVKQEAVSYLFNLDVEATQAAQDTNDHQ
jgi:preprotein translocase subunit SecA